MSIIQRLFFYLAEAHSWLAAWRERSAPLHTARWIYFHELAATFVDRLSGTQILLGKTLMLNGLATRVVAVKPTKLQRELGHVLLVGKHRSGKGLNIETNLLTWPHSVIVNDIKGELYHRTAGYRASIGTVFRFDPRGNGARFDPLAGKTTDSELRSAATTLLYRPDEGQNAAFTERAITMLVAIFTAALLEGERALPFTYKMINEGLYAAAMILEIISQKHHAYPNLAKKFLDMEYGKADFDSKFLQDCWSTLTARMSQILTKESVTCFTGSDFTAKEILTSPSPISVYLSWPEEHVLSLAPLIRLVWDCLVSGMIGYYDDPAVQGKGCMRVLCVLDEIFRTGLPKLPEYTTTVSGRNISLLISAQSIAQMDKAYGRFTAEVLRGQMDATLFYRPAADDNATAAHIEQACGYRSGFARSHTAHDSGESTGQSEQRVPLMPAHEAKHLEATEVIGLVTGLHPFRERRLNRYEFPELTKRGNIPAPTVSPLPELDLGRGRDPQFTLVGLPNGSDGERHNQGNHHQGNTLWHRERKLPNGYIDPDKRY
jgi:type IV secretion system protein VirD4